ncbi:MAG: amino acid adenylation domain-containing protein, partial [Chloroflexi bacterium]|nr:amino acid adenylation domain-containing protein [Chloroflexota bacterium]
MSFPPTMHSSIDKKGIFSIKTNEYISNSPLQRLKESNDIILAPDGFAKFEISEIEQSIPDRFEKIARQFPENIAVKSKTDCLTYSALNKVANRIAHTILQQSNQGKMVAVLLRQGSDFLAAMLGVLKSGKLYIPMDPSFPQERINQIITDSQPDTLITTSDYYALAQELVQDDCQLINIDAIASDISVENPKLHISADTLAYIIYTSGSTGRPKGVIQNHRNVLHNCCNNTNSYQIGAADRIILLYSSSVMGAVRAIYYALMNGAALFHVDVKEDGLAELTRTVTQEKITVYHSVTSLFRFFAATLSSVDKFPHLRGIILGGEATLRSDVALFKKHFPHAMLYLGLGSTEAGGTMRQIVLDQETILHSSTVPLGY